jgi:hypothetical protein
MSNKHDGRNQYIDLHTWFAHERSLYVSFMAILVMTTGGKDDHVIAATRICSEILKPPPAEVLSCFNMSLDKR